MSPLHEFMSGLAVQHNSPLHIQDDNARLPPSSFCDIIRHSPRCTAQACTAGCRRNQFRRSRDHSSSRWETCAATAAAKSTIKCVTTARDEHSDFLPSLLFKSATQTDSRTSSSTQEALLYPETPTPACRWGENSSPCAVSPTMIARSPSDSMAIQEASAQSYDTTSLLSPATATAAATEAEVAAAAAAATLFRSLHSPPLPKRKVSGVVGDIISASAIAAVQASSRRNGSDNSLASQSSGGSTRQLQSISRNRYDQPKSSSMTRSMPATIRSLPY